MEWNLSRDSTAVAQSYGPWSWRKSARVLRRFRKFSAAEDAVQEALLAAATQW
jgi:predicted RNA polymerase sigma factor